MMNRTDTAQVLAVLSAAFPHVNVSRETAEVYHDVLGDLDADACRAAVRELLMTAERWPAPATIRRRVAERAGVLAPEPGAAWGEVVAQAGAVGLYGDPVFSHPAVKAAVRAIGWRSVCLSENQDTLRAHFFRAYEPERTQADTRTITDSLVGLGGSVPVRALGVGA
jgi:hypothetical protein